MASADGRAVGSERARARSGRITAGLPARVIYAGEASPGRIEDFSCSGALVQTAAELVPGDSLDLEVCIPGIDLLSVRCDVVRQEQPVEGNRIPRVGVCFSEAQPYCDRDQLQELGELLMTLRQLKSQVLGLAPGAELRVDDAKIPSLCLLHILAGTGFHGSLAACEGQHQGHVAVLSFRNGALETSEELASNQGRGLRRQVLSFLGPHSQERRSCLILRDVSEQPPTPGRSFALRDLLSDYYAF